MDHDSTTAPGHASQPDPVTRLFDVRGKVAVVTGASSGLGEGFARTLAQAGVTVFAAARRVERLEVLAEEHESVIPVACDVTIDADRRALVERAIAGRGRIDILVNTAGIPGPPYAEQETEDGFRRILEVNLASQFHLATAVAATVPEGREASIINVSSVIGMVSTAPIGGAGYAASKAGVLGLTRELAGQWGRRGIRVSAIVPGWFDTEMTEGLFTNERSATWVRRNTMLNRGGRAGEVDGALLFLASPASSYVTGQAIVVDGGWTAR